MSKTHDYTTSQWGHAVEIITVAEDGMHANVIGFGLGVEVGDYLILATNVDTTSPGAPRIGTTRYKIDTIERKRPVDCWAATISFAPRQASEL